MIDFRADLHCHSIYSDGSLSPSELLLLAKKNELSGLAITDHDSVEAYPTAFSTAQEIGIELISGVEFSAVHHEVSVHILGYSFCVQHPIIADFCQRHKQRREERNKTILENLAAHKMPISNEELTACLSNHLTTIGRPHIALAMVKKGYVETILDAFKNYLGEGKCCYARGALFTVEETLHVIHEAKGLAIIAHPQLIKDSRTIIQLLSMNFDGLEGYYGMLFPNQEERWIKIAKKKNWLITGGSDFHGAVKPSIPLGCSWVGEETFRHLQRHYQASCAA